MVQLGLPKHMRLTTAIEFAALQFPFWKLPHSPVGMP